MSKDLNTNERYLKELAAKNHPAPPPLVWDEIEQVLDEDKNKRRPFLLLWIFGGLLSLLIGAIMFINLRGNHDIKTPRVEQETIINNHQKRSDPNSRNIQREISTVNSESIKDEKQEENIKVTETTLTVLDNQEEGISDSELHQVLITQQSQLTNINPSIASRSLDVNKNPINTHVTPIITREDIHKPSIPDLSTLEERNMLQVNVLPILKRIGSPFLVRKPLPDPSKNLTLVPISESIDKAPLSSPWFIEVGGGIGKNLSNPVLINPSQGELRLNTESKWYAWSTAFQVGYGFDNHWYTTIGLDLNQTKSKFDFWRRDVSSLLVSDNQSLQITNSDFFNIGEISYTFADVGLSIGKRFNLDKWHLSLEGGTIINVLFNANGKVQVGDLEFSRLENQEKYFNSQIGIGGRLSAMLDYPLSNNLWISAGTTYHQYFKTLSSDENPLEERNAILQVKTKVRYHF